MNFSEAQRLAFVNAVHFILSDREGAELDAVGAKNYLDLTTMHYGSEPVVCDTGYVTITDHLARNLTNIRLGQVGNKYQLHGEDRRSLHSRWTNISSRFCARHRSIGSLESEANHVRSIAPAVEIERHRSDWIWLL